MSWRDEIGPDEHILRKLLKLIPGYKGYRERELRREADKLLRGRLAQHLQDTHKQLTRLEQKLSAQNLFTPLADMQRLSRQLKRLIDRLEHAPYGYAGFLAAVQINEAELERLYQYDLALTENVESLAASAEALATAQPEQWEEALHALEEQIAAFSQLLDERSQAAIRMAP